MMLSLGTFQFSVSTACYDQLSRSVNVRWAKLEPVFTAPRRHFTGPGDETMEISGTIYPGVAGTPKSLSALIVAARTGDPQLMVDGGGWVLGRWCVEDVNQTGTLHFADGNPRKIDFSLRLSRYTEVS